MVMVMVRLVLGVRWPTMPVLWLVQGIEATGQYAHSRMQVIAYAPSLFQPSIIIIRRSHHALPLYGLG
jgi:hypothetical protein